MSNYIILLCKKEEEAILPNKFLMNNANYKKTKIPQNKSMLIFLE